MAEKKPDLTVPKNLMNWALYGLAAVAGWAYFDMRTQRDNCQKENNYYARQSFDNALKIREQSETIKVLDTVIQETKAYITDSTQLVNVKNFKGNIKIKQK